MNLDTKLLTAFREASGTHVRGADLASRLGVTENQLVSRIDELRRLGYLIESSPHLGWRLMDSPDALHADDLLARLGSVQCVGREIYVFNETTSTNDVADKLARSGVKEGTVVIAESQTRGRGRLGRNWISPAGKGLWFSVLLRPPLPPQNVTQVTVASATALARAVAQQTRLPVEIKWPNDLVLGGRKVAGILTELAAELDTVKYVILGIGVDVNLDRTDFPPELAGIATSLKIESGRLIDRAQLLVAILQELGVDYARLCRGEFEAVADSWERACTTIGRQVTIQSAGRQVVGRAEALDSDGALLVRTEHGRLERITGGDVTLEKSAPGADS